jgi:hypothetical protein
MTLFAPINILDGTITGRNMQRNRHPGFREVLKCHRSRGTGRQDGSRHPRQLRRPEASQGPRWLDRHARFVFRFSPASCSWLNAVEGFFATLSRRGSKRMVFRTLVDLEPAINRFLAETNAEPKPFTWTADPDKIIAAVQQGTKC